MGVEAADKGKGKQPLFVEVFVEVIEETSTN
jgi:hypothetical protein